MERSLRFRRSGQFDVTVAVLPLQPVEGKSHQKEILTLTLTSIYSHIRTEGNVFCQKMIVVSTDCFAPAKRAVAAYDHPCANLKCVSGLVGQLTHRVFPDYSPFPAASVKCIVSLSIIHGTHYG